MVKALAGVLCLVLIGFVAYHKSSSAPMDSRSAIESGVEQIKGSTSLTPEQEKLLRVQLAIEDFTREGGKPPSSLEVLIPKYFDQVPKDPATGKPYKYVLNGERYVLGEEVDTAVAKAKSDQPFEPDSSLGIEVDGKVLINPNTLELEIFTYDPDGRRDPFETFDFSGDTDIDMSLPPLQRYTLGQLKVTAILADSVNRGQMIALVEDASGRGYTVRKGTEIGNQSGVVVSIEKDRINIVETTIDFTGKVNKRAVVMKIPVRSSADQDTFNKTRKIKRR